MGYVRSSSGSLSSRATSSYKSVQQRTAQRPKSKSFSIPSNQFATKKTPTATKTSSPVISPQTKFASASAAFKNAIETFNTALSSITSTYPLEYQNVIKGAINSISAAMDAIDATVAVTKPSSTPHMSSPSTTNANLALPSPSSEGFSPRENQEADPTSTTPILENITGNISDKANSSILENVADMAVAIETQPHLYKNSEYVQSPEVPEIFNLEGIASSQTINEVIDAISESRPSDLLDASSTMHGMVLTEEAPIIAEYSDAEVITGTGANEITPKAMTSAAYNITNYVFLDLSQPEISSDEVRQQVSVVA